MDSNFLKQLKKMVEQGEVTRSIALLDRNAPFVKGVNGEFINALTNLTKALKKFVKQEIEEFDNKFSEGNFAEDYYIEAYKALSASIKDKCNKCVKSVTMMLKKEKSPVPVVVLHQINAQIYVTMIASGIDGVGKYQQNAFFHYKTAVLTAQTKIKGGNSTKYLLFFDYAKFIYGIMEDKFRCYLICKETMKEMANLTEKNEETEVIEKKFKEFYSTKEDEFKEVLSEY